MKLRTAVIVSGILHITLFALVIQPTVRKGSGEMTYYVDLVQLSSGGRGGSPGGGNPGGGQQTAPKVQDEATLLTQENQSVRQLTVQKEVKSSLRYPDKEGKQKEEEEEDKLIRVVRKDRAIEKKSESNQPATTPAGLRTGLSTSGEGNGTGNGVGNGLGDGSGDGVGGGGGYFPYAYYVDILRNRISSSWYSSLVTPGLKGKFLASVYFNIDRAGQISDLHLEKSSGNTSLDLSALRAVENAAPFAPLPPDFPSAFLIVHFEFEWEK